MLHSLKGEGNCSFKIEWDAVIAFKVFAKYEENIQTYTKPKARLKPKLINQNRRVLTDVFKREKKKKENENGYIFLEQIPMLRILGSSFPMWDKRWEKRVLLGC